MRRGIFFSFLCFVSMYSAGQELESKIIQGYGKIRNYEDIEVQPDSELEYKMVFDLKSEKEKDGVNEGLVKIARTLNLLGAAHIEPSKIKIVAAIHGGATPLALKEDKYQEKYGKPNPNLELMRLLREQGVELFVCAQATAAMGIADSDLNSFVKPALSALIVLSNYQLNGYALLP
ncbi:DsrE family protein [Pareuzebyella sediminis]|uniref:DsrE family protein n=1 Tax=Pareuzebyella sediminis TaxID=2607998 RepID=UPI0011EC022A|nr:DsrE family protein [Pareuzebyella sediminis]